MINKNVFLPIISSTLLLSLMAACPVSADVHSVQIDPGQSENAETQGTAEVVYDVLTDKGYLVNIAGRDDTGSNASPEITVFLTADDPAGSDSGTTDEGGTSAGDKAVKIPISPVLAQSSQDGESFDDQSLMLAQAILDSYTTVAQKSPDTPGASADLSGDGILASVDLAAFEKDNKPLDPTSESDQAWAGYIVANGIEQYFEPGGDNMTNDTNAPAGSEVAGAQTADSTGAAQPLDNSGAAQPLDSTGAAQPLDSTGTAQSLDSTGAAQESSSAAAASSNSLATGHEKTEDATRKLIQTLTTAYSSLPKDNGQWAVYLRDLKNNVSAFAPNTGDQPMKAASLIKLYIMGAVYENYDQLAAAYGSAALDGYLNPMITVSDNDAANALVTYLGGGDPKAGQQVVTNFAHAHGYNSTSMGRMLLEQNPTGENYTSVKDCGRFLSDVYRGAKSGAASASGSVFSQQGSQLAHASEMFELLKAQQVRHKIPADMPAGVHVANKTGELSDVENDAGIIYDTDNGNDLIMVFMSEYLSNTGAAQSSIAQTARLIYDAYHS